MQAASYPLQRNASGPKDRGLRLCLVLLLWMGAFQPAAVLGQAPFYDYSWFEDTVSKMPFALTNNAVTGAVTGLNFYAYSFGGIDSSKIWSGISRASFRYNTNSGSFGVPGEWLELPLVPDTLGKIASAASTVKNKIYVIGGYHVLEDGTEISSNRVHIFDPGTNTWQPDGAPVPVPIDDHVQVVYKDSLIYVVTGWSNTSTVSNVQIYNPALDEWTVGTPVPSTSQYKAFGAAGGLDQSSNTIVYVGGARMGFDFPMAPFIRRGVIDEADPTQISWSVYEDSLAGRYRAAATSGYAVLFFGGSSKTYNYNGIAYDGSGGVSPQTLEFMECRFSCNPSPPFHTDTFRVMDIRGVAEDPNGLFGMFPNGYVILGGMGPAQELTGTAHASWLLYEGLEAPQQVGLSVHPSLTSGPVQVRVDDPAAYGQWNYQVLDLSGRVVNGGQITPPAELDLSAQPTGLYFLQLERNGRRVGLKMAVAR